MSTETKKILDKYIDTKKCVGYLKKQQNHDGSYPGLKPCPVTTMHCLKILKLLGRKPQYKNTVKWIQSLQTGKRGFGETTGQNSWDYTTYFGSEMHKALDIRPRHEKELEKFILNHMNEDGGFSSDYEPRSNLRSTIYWCLAALNLGFKIEQKTYEYLNEQLKYFNNMNLSQIYNIITILRSNNVHIDNESKIKEFIQNSKESLLQRVYYSSKILDNSNEEVNKKFIAGFNNVFHSPQISLMILELHLQQGISFNKQDFAEYVDGLEMTGGGYYDKKQTHLLSAYECILGLKMLNDQPDICAADWIKTLQTPDGGFATTKGASSWINMPFRALRILKTSDDTIDTFHLRNYLDKTIYPINSFNAFYGTCAYVELNELPPGHRKIVKDIMKFQTFGGFSDPIDGQPNMYATERSVCAMSNIMKLLDAKKKIHMNWLLKIKKKVVDWIYQCENKEGFSWIPDEISYIQPTFLALHTLWVLKTKPNHLEDHIQYITKCVNTDGGYHGGEKGTPSGTLYTYYVLASLLILDSFKNQNTDIDHYLGL